MPTSDPVTLGELAREGREVLIWCNRPHCRHRAARPAAELAQLLGPGTSVYGCWVRMRCGECGARGRERGALFAMPTWPDVSMGLGAG